MSRSHPRVVRSSVAFVACVLALGAARRAGAEQILTIHSDSLTAYRASAKSNIQDVRTLVDQRGVDLDGTLRAPSTHDASLAGGPSGERWNANQRLGGMRLDTGTFVINEVPSCMGTIDLCGCATGEGDDGDWYDAGNCGWELGCVFGCHNDLDVQPYEDDPWKYNQIQCCIRSLGMCSGNGGDWPPSDVELQMAHNHCKCKVEHCLYLEGDYCD